jgi:hypothetical protein
MSYDLLYLYEFHTIPLTYQHIKILRINTQLRLI